MLKIDVHPICVLTANKNEIKNLCGCNDTVTNLIKINHTQRNCINEEYVLCYLCGMEVKFKDHCKTCIENHFRCIHCDNNVEVSRLMTHLDECKGKENDNKDEEYSEDESDNNQSCPVKPL